ncbi:MAG TPA: riboflavin synthase [Gammaproteobacteria bacterium]|jgi:riboflavin synthase
MFTGIVQATGTVRATHRSGPDLRLAIAADAGFADLETGESVCVNGVCLTVATADTHGFEVDVSAATLSCTTLGSLSGGARVNLERALRASDRLGGHFVSGHVSGVGRVVRVAPAGGSLHLEIEAPTELSRYFCSKGSICVDGVSLTINGTAGARFDVNIVPQTRDRTIISRYGPGTEVNLEVDLVARYLEGLLAARD